MCYILSSNRILFLVGVYYPYSDAIGSCILKLQEELIRENIHSDVITYAEKTGFLCKGKYGNVYGVKSSDRDFNVQFNNTFERIIKTAPYFFAWPLSRPLQLFKMKRQVKDLEKRNNYDAIIGTSLPIDTLLVAVTFKKSIVYELDGLSCNPNYRRGIKKYLNHRVKILEKKIFRNADLIIHMIQNKEWYSGEKYKKFWDKCEYSDIPNLIKPNVDDYKESTEYPRLIYAGFLIRDYRSPEYILDLLKAVSGSMRFIAEFYSSGDCQELVRDAQQKTKGSIKLKERVSSDKLDSIMKQSDFLLSVGNNLSGNDKSFPSKIITYMALQKPIIHIAGNSNDSAIPYIEKYGLSLILYPEHDFNDNKEKLIQFISANKGKESNFEKTRTLFPMNTPEYTVGIIRKFIQKDD